MENILHIQSITKQEFKSIIEEILENKISLLEKNDKPINITVQTCSKLLSVSELTIYNYIKKGLIPAKKIGRKYIINSAQLDSILQDVKSLKYRRDA